MSRRTAVLGIASGLACALCVGLYAFQIDQEAQLQRAEALEKYGGSQVEVYVARRDLAAGEAIDDSAVEKRQWLAELLPDGAVTDLELVRGSLLNSPVFAGEVVCAGRLKADTDQLTVPEGMCALSVPGKDVQTVGGRLAAGMEADVYVTGPSGSSLLAERVAVLAVGKEGGVGSGNCWVTIAVEPSLVQEMVQAAQSYELYFAMPGADTRPGDEPQEKLTRGNVPEPGQAEDRAQAAGTSVSAGASDELAERENTDVAIEGEAPGGAAVTQLDADAADDARRAGEANEHGERAQDGGEA